MPLRPTYPVRSARLALRPLSEADAAGIAAYRSLDEVCRWVPFEPMDEAAVASRIREQWSRSTALEEEGDTLFLGIELAGEAPGGDAGGVGGTGGFGGELVGAVMLRWASAEHGSGELGYELNPAHQGAGYATEAAHAVMHLGFDGFGLHRVFARVDARNTPSAGVAARLGMRQEAHLVENEWFKGRWSDELDFALLESEWRAQHASGCPWSWRQRESG